MKRFQLLVLGILLSSALCAQNSPTFRYQNELGGKEKIYDTSGKLKFLYKNRTGLDSVGIITRKSYKLKGVRNYVMDTVYFLPYSQTGFFQIGHTGLYNIDTLNSYLYNQSTVDFLQSFSLESYIHDNSVVNVELASFLFGPVRAGIGGSFKTDKDPSKTDSVKTDLQRIIHSGGTFNLNFLVPLMFCQNYSGQLHFGLFGQIYNGLTPSKDTGASSGYFTNPLFINKSGIMFHFDVSSNDKRGRFVFEIPITYSWGSPETYNQLGIADYSLIQLQIGAVLGDLVSFRVTGPLYSSSKTVQSLPYSLALQFSPSQVAKTAGKK